MISGRGARSAGAVRRSRAGLAGLAALLALAVMAPAANALVVRLANGSFQGVYLRSGVSATAYERQTGAAPVTLARRANASTGSADNLIYEGGPVLHTTRPYLVFWDPGNTISVASRAVLTQYLTDAGQDGANPADVYAYRVLAQYHDASGFAAQGQSFSSATQVIPDHDAYPAPSPCTSGEQSGFTACITDAEIQAELTHLITTTGLPSGIGSDAPVYFVVTPQDVNVCQGGGGGCSSGDFCAYHSAYRLPAGSADVVYASIPFTLGASCQGAGLGSVQEPNGDVADVIADNLSHENSEAITDPLPGGNTAWVTGNGYEVADQCELQGPNNPNDNSNSPNGPTSLDAYLPTLGGTESDHTLYDQLINNHRYFTQTEWSNSDDNCMAKPTAATITASFAPPASATPGAAASFDPAASSSSNGYSSTTWNWGDGSSDTFLTGPPTAASHTYAAAGSYTVTLTLVDGGGNTARVSHTIFVGTPLTAAFAPSASTAQANQPIAFDASGSRDPNPGRSITAYHWSFGDGSPAGSGASASHAYASPGTYTVTLQLTGSEGLTAAVSHLVTIVAAPTSSTPSSPVVVSRPAAITGVSVKHAKGKYYLQIAVNRPGTVRVRSGRILVGTTGKARFLLSLSRAQRRRLAKHGTVSLRLTITYVPRVGAPVSQTRTVKLRP